jgi:hypothetical protein
MSVITNPSDSEITGEIRHFFEVFCADFSEFDGALIAQRYATPYTSLNAAGTLQVFSTQEQISQYFQGFLNKYHEQGCRTCRFQELQVVPLGQMSALASLTWELLRNDQSVASTWRESYNLSRMCNELRIYASTDHVEIE